MSNLLHLDKEVFLWINSHHNLLFDAILTPIAYAGEAGTIWVLTAVVLFILNKPNYRRTAVLLVVAIIVLDCVGRMMSAGFDRPRPYLEIEGVRQVGLRWQSGSFPSGHAHSSWAAAVILGSRWHKLILPLVVFAVLTCYSRPYFGMHYPIDVLAGAAIGIVGGSFAVLVDRRIQGIGRVKSNGC